MADQDEKVFSLYSVLGKGKKVFIRTVTNYFVGQVSDADETHIALIDASWIPNTGRFSEALSKGEFDEVEPYPEGTIVMRAAIVDFCSWPHPLPRTMK